MKLNAVVLAGRTLMVDIALGITLGNLPVLKLMRYARLAERLGFKTIGIPELYFSRDAITQATLAALATKRIKIMLSTISPYTRNPALIAMSALTLDEVSRGRLILGLGVGALPWVKYQLKVELRSPLTVLKESIEVLRRLFNREKLSLKGEALCMEGVQLSLKPLRPRLPIYLGVLGPKLLQLAGGKADGVVLSGGTPIDYVDFAVKNVKHGAKEAGRDLSEINVAANVLYCPSLSIKALKLLRERLLFFISLPEFNVVIRHSPLYAEKLLIIREAINRGKPRKALNLLDYSLLRALALIGDRDECLRKIEKYRKAGVNELIISPIYLNKAALNAIQGYVFDV